MKNQIIKTTFIAMAISGIFSACTKDKKAPVPDEQELITTLKIQLIEPFSSFVQTFEYKVENGFGNGSAGTIKIDTLKLKPGTTYDAVLMVLNEKATPAEDITNEIVEKSEEHLFVFNSTPATGSGSLQFLEGSKDKNGQALNQTFKLTTGSAGSGKFEITLLHQPTDKSATSPAGAGGETDLSALFPVILQ